MKRLLGTAILLTTMTAMVVVVYLLMRWDATGLDRLRSLTSPAVTAPVPVSPAVEPPSRPEPAATGMTTARLPAADLPPLSAHLAGTILGRHPGEHRAVVEDELLDQRLTLAAGERLQGRMISAIARGYIRLRLPSGKEELLVMADTSHPDALIQTVGTDEYRVDRRRLAEAIHWDVRHLRDEVELRPHLQRFQLAGVRLVRVPPQSFAAQAGLQSSDVVTAVNGIPLNSLPTALAIYHLARQSPSITLELSRQGAPRTLRYHLE